MTWPQARYLGTHVHDSDDPLLSIWRISWIAHILPTSPTDLMNGNIFFPEERTLAYTDAVLMQGLVAAPLIWAGLAPTLVYNLLILGSIALSGWAMWLYAYHLTKNAAGSVLAGIVFAFVPFRFDHLHHLELQATMFLPLALLYTERALDTGARRHVWAAMAAIVAQVYCGIYYAVFLVTALLVAVPLRWRRLPPERRRALWRAAPAAAAASALVVLPYLAMYMLNRNNLGDRTDHDVRLFSATLWNYLATPEENIVHGSWSAAFGQNERRLFPGFVALGLAAFGFSRLGPRRITLIVVGLTGFLISLGLNTPLYEMMRAVLFTYRGLRAPARASILLFLVIGAFVAYGWARIEPAFKRRAGLAAVIAAIALLFEYSTVMRYWYVASPEPPAVYRWLATQPRSVVIELPVTTSDKLNLVPDGIYMFRSTSHWQPILNGYSGFFPKSYLELLDRMRTFPADDSIDYLKQRGVDLIVLHGSLMDPDAFGKITATLLARPDIAVTAQFEEQLGPDLVLRLSR
jgi:hypothetical protein